MSQESSSRPQPQYWIKFLDPWRQDFYPVLGWGLAPVWGEHNSSQHLHWIKTDFPGKVKNNLTRFSGEWVAERIFRGYFFLKNLGARKKTKKICAKLVQNPIPNKILWVTFSITFSELSPAGVYSKNSNSMPSSALLQVGPSRRVLHSAAVVHERTSSQLHRTFIAHVHRGIASRPRTPEGLESDLRPLGGPNSAIAACGFAI